MKFKELTTKSEADIKKMLEDLKHEAHELAVKIRTSELKQTHKLKAVKKDIARIMTLLNNKK
jgi:large subunit ribosomal protein L29